MKYLSDKKILILVILAPALFLFLAHYYLTGFAIYSDGIGYYIYGRSLLIDQDLQFENEWEFYNQSTSHFSTISRGESAYPVSVTPKGYLENIYLIGNSLLWSPFILAAHILALILSLIGLNILANGYTFPYEFGIGIASLFYGLLAAIFIYKFLNIFFEKDISLIATIGVWLGTGAIWYHSVEPSMSHINSILVATLFIYFWYITFEKRSMLQWFGLGVLAGLMFLVRQQDILIGLLPAFESLRQYWLNREKVNKIIVEIKSNIIFIAGLILALIPQIIVWLITHGAPIVYSYGRVGESWAIPQVIPFLFSPEIGMIRYPVMALGLIGLFYFSRKQKQLALFFGLALIPQILVSSAWPGGWSTDFGLRFLLSYTVIFAIGFASILEWVKTKWSPRFAIALAVFLIIFNFFNMTLFLLGEVTNKVSLTEIPALILNLI